MDAMGSRSILEAATIWVDAGQGINASLSSRGTPAYQWAMADLSFTGGCLCGALRFAATGGPLWAGYCCCGDCRRASGSGFIPFLGFPAAALSFSGETRQFRSRSFRGGDAVRNFCPVCGALVFGGEAGIDDSHTVYAGALDDPSLFEPSMALFTRDRPAWVVLPPGLTLFETMPG